MRPQLGGLEVDWHKAMQVNPAPNAELPMVTAVIPAYKAERWIEATLDSVQAQTYPALEIIVVDDGSPDRSAAIVAARAEADPRIRLIQRDNGGLSAARNTGIYAASGEYVALVDADDLWAPTKIERQVDRFLRARSAGESLGLVYCWSVSVDDEGRRTRLGLATSTAEGDVFEVLSRTNIVSCGSAAMIPTKLAIELGGYPEEMRSGCEDWAFHLRIAKDHKFGVVAEELVGYRQRSDSMSVDLQLMLRGQRDANDYLRRHDCAVRPRDRRHQEALLMAWGLIRSFVFTPRQLGAAFLEVLREDPWFPFRWPTLMPLAFKCVRRRLSQHPGVTRRDFFLPLTHELQER